MGSTLRPTVTNIFMYRFGNFRNFEIISINIAKTKFGSKIEDNGLLPFLDIKISRKNNKFVTSAYCKSTFSCAFKIF